MRSVGDIALNLSLHTRKREFSQHVYGIVLILVASVPFDVLFHYIDNA